MKAPNPKKKCLIIAEAGVNHNGDFQLAKDLVDQAKNCGADIVKFQSFKASKLTTQSAQMADYQKKNTGMSESQFDMLKRLELSEDQQIELANYCKSVGIEFLSSPFDLESAFWLIDQIGLTTLKVGSGELTNSPLLLGIAQRGVKMIISTGMANLSEIEMALANIAFGYLNPSRKPNNTEEIWSAFNQEEAHSILREKVTVLHCTTEYPAPFDETNLRAMAGLSRVLGLRIGFSDHTPGTAIPIAAVALGARVIEKHFTLDKSMDGPDHKASLNPEELKLMVDGIRQTELALGQTRKAPTATEIKNKNIARKSIVAAKEIQEGQEILLEDLDFKRPGTGISPARVWDLVGHPSKRSFAKDELIEL